MSGPRNAEDRLRRLLVMLPWLMEVGEVELAAVAERFGMTESQVQRDLELVAMCGLPPFVDEMIDVFVDDGVVVVGVPRLFTRPLRLTAPEGFALLAAGRAAMELPGADPSGPLGRGLAKLAAALGADDGDNGSDVDADPTAGFAVDMSRPHLSDDVLEAAATATELSIDYYSPARDASTRRTIVPRHVFTERGNWYVVADDERSAERRTFRIDRIEGIDPTGRTVPADEPVTRPSAFFQDEELPRATLRLAPAARWVVEQYPVDDVHELDDGGVEVTLAVSSDRWLSRLLIRLGPLVEEVAPASASEAASELASSILARYETGAGNPS